ncbi:hypothetical protein EBR96_07810 [bacterium]|nr:hypothetical protein [bacterium]
MRSFVVLAQGDGPTIAGVLTAIMIPSAPEGESSPGERLRHVLAPIAASVCVPLFVLANGGVRLAGLPIREIVFHPIALGSGLGLFIGKFVGILGGTWLAVILRVGRLPDRIGWTHVAGVGGLGGIGFTVSFFVTQLAFQDPESVDIAKLGIVAGSFASAVLGLALLSWASYRKRAG